MLNQKPPAGPKAKDDRTTRLSTRITADSRMMGGKPCIRGTRVTVATIAGLLAAGHPVVEILEVYPHLEREDVEAVIDFTRDARGRDGVEQADLAKPASMEGSESAETGEVGSNGPTLSPEAQRIVEATLALPEADQEWVLVGIIASLEDDGGLPDGEIERLWSELVHLKLKRARRRAAPRPEGEMAGNRKAASGADGGQEKPSGSSAGDSLTYTVRSLRYPFLVEGEVDGLPFCLLEEGETWRFVVSRDPAVEPQTVRSNREGFVVSGCVGITRVRGESDGMTEDQVLDLIDVSRSILRERVRRGRAKDAPGLSRSPSRSGTSR